MLEILGVSVPIAVPFVIGVGVLLSLYKQKISALFKRRNRRRVVEYTTKSGFPAKGELLGKNPEGHMVIRNGAGVTILIDRKTKLRVA